MGVTNDQVFRLVQEKRKKEGLKMKYFLLKPRSKTLDDAYAKASREAMKTYARIIKYDNEQLSEDLINWVQDEEKFYIESLKRLHSEEL